MRLISRDCLRWLVTCAVHIFASMLCAVFAPAPTPLATVNGQQHIIFHNGVVLTMDPANAEAEALEITGQKIAAVGTDEEILAWQRAETRVVDLDGRSLMSGEAGYQAVIHAIGDRGIEQAQKAIAAAMDGQPNTLRHRIEHNSVIRPELPPRYGEIGVIPVLFGLYPTCEPFGPPPPPEYRSWEWPYRAFLDANPDLPVAWHGDDPFFGRVRPLDDLYSLVTRNGVGEDGEICEAPDWQAQHTITAEEALQMMTFYAAYALFREEEVGSLAPGKYADVIVLSDNPLRAQADVIAEMEVRMTMVGGRVAFCDPDHQAVCP